LIMMTSVVPAVLILMSFVMLLFMLFDLTSICILGLFMIVYEIVMIYILVLI